LLWWALLSHYRLHPAQGVFLLTGLSLGVGMLLGTLILGEAAKASLHKAEDALNGQVVGRLVPLNQQATMSEEIYTRLRLAGVSDISPVLEGALKTDAGYLKLQGLDLFSLLNRHSSSDEPSSPPATYQRLYDLTSGANNENSDSENIGLIQFSFSPFLAVVSESYAQMLNIESDDTVAIDGGADLPAIHIVSDDMGLGYTVMCDLRCAQQALSLRGRISEVVFTAPPDLALISSLAGEAAVYNSSDKTLKTPAFSDAFLLNLKAIGLLAFLVGCFIAFNAVKFSVIQRVESVKLLRVCGATFTEVIWALSLELIFWIALASILGGIVGWGLATALLPSIGMTLNQLFYNENLLFVADIQQWWLSAVLLSAIATITATFASFKALAKQPPLGELKTASQSAYYIFLPYILLGLGLMLTQLPGSQSIGFMITACWFIGGGLLVPSILTLVYRGLGHLRGLIKYPAIHWLVADGRENTERFSISMLTLAIALAACVAVVTMVSSFRSAFVDYLEFTLSESIYLDVDTKSVSSVEDFLTRENTVDYYYRFYQANALVNNHRSLVVGVSDHPRRHNSFGLEKSEADVWLKFHRREGVIVNQAFALAHDVGLGDEVAINVNGVDRHVRVLGINLSYGSLAPTFVIDQGWLAQLWPSLSSTKIGVFIDDSKAVDEILGRLVSDFALDSRSYFKPQEIKVMALSIFGQTFMAANLLSIVILLVAAVGVFCACYAHQLAISRQTTLVRILGVSTGSLNVLSVAQVALNSLFAVLIALPLGIVIAWVAIFYVLRYSFGWYFDLNVSWFELLYITGASMFLVILGAIFPLLFRAKKADIHKLSIDA